MLVPVGVVVATLPSSLIVLAFGGGLFVFPTIAAGVMLLRGNRAAPVVGVVVAVAMAALLLHARTWAGDLKHAWFFWPLMAYAAVTGVLALAGALMERPSDGRPPVVVAVALLVLGLGSAWWVAAG